MGVIEDDAKLVKQICLESHPKSIATSKGDGTIHSHPTDSATVLAKRAIDNKWAYELQTVFELKTKDTYMGNDGNMTKDVDMSKVTEAVVVEK